MIHPKVFTLFLTQLSGVKGICWAAAIAEAVVVVASHNSHWGISRIVLEKLVFEGSPDSIRLTPLFLLGTSMTAFGGFIRWRCYRELGKLFTFEMSIRKNHKLVMSGPYAVVRHPGYTGILFTIVGIVCWHASPVCVAVLWYAAPRER